MASWKSGRNQYNTRRLCPNCGLNMWSECQCFSEYLDEQFPLRLIGEDAYAEARHYTPMVMNTDKEKKQ